LVENVGGREPMYIQRRRRKWFAFHDIPADVQPVFGKVRFTQSLDTEDHATAVRRKAALEMKWRALIEQARRGKPDQAAIDAAFWRKLIADAPEDQQELLASALEDELDAKVQRAAKRAGVDTPQDPRFEQLPERIEANRVYAIATGAMVRLNDHLEEYLGTLQNEPKSVDMKRSTIKKFCEQFPYVEDVQRKEVQRWINSMIENGKAIATIRRSLSELRGYWAYLGSIDAVTEGNAPFEKLVIPKPAKRNGNGDERKPFDAADVVRLLEAAELKQDRQLADLIRLGMWTGALIEELCALKVGKVGDGYFDIEDAKTSAGWRKVPVHPQLVGTILRLVKDSKDGYVLSGLTTNKYGDRSNAVGKRFGRLKTELGFGEEHVFHSIRKTVATLLENAGVPENVSADILGHDKPTMTYGLYSGGSTLEVKRKALEKIGYPMKD
jgi:integrase